jgi:hypothetical protein
LERINLGNPSKRVNKNPHVTPQCEGCIFENESEAARRPCFQCSRKEWSIDSNFYVKELMAHYKEYFDKDKRKYHDYYTKKGTRYNPKEKEDWLRLRS